MCKEKEAPKKNTVSPETIRFFQTLRNSIADTGVRDPVSVTIEITKGDKPPWKFSVNNVNAFSLWDAVTHILENSDTKT